MEIAVAEGEYRRAGIQGLSFPVRNYRRHRGFHAVGSVCYFINGLAVVSLYFAFAIVLGIHEPGAILQSGKGFAGVPHLEITGVLRGCVE